MPLLVVHIVAAALGLATGYVALYAPKGERVHRKAGRLFVLTMLVMSVAGIFVALLRDAAVEVNVPAGLLTAYLVVTGRMALERPTTRWLEVAGMLVALGIGSITLAFGVEAIANGGERDGIPAFPFVMFGVVGLLASAGDLRRLRSGAPRVPHLARHLWRMCFALFIAALSFFIGQAKVIPKAIRIPPLLAFPVVIIPITLVYWAWRVRRPRRS